MATQRFYYEHNLTNSQVGSIQHTGQQQHAAHGYAPAGKGFFPANTPDNGLPRLFVTAKRASDDAVLGDRRQDYNFCQWERDAGNHPAGIIAFPSRSRKDMLVRQASPTEFEFGRQPEQTMCTMNFTKMLSSSYSTVKRESYGHTGKAGKNLKRLRGNCEEVEGNGLALEQTECQRGHEPPRKRKRSFELHGDENSLEGFGHEVFPYAEVDSEMVNL